MGKMGVGMGVFIHGRGRRDGIHGTRSHGSHLSEPCVRIRYRTYPYRYCEPLFFSISSEPPAVPPS
jgi:hypothetical protein